MESSFGDNTSTDLLPTATPSLTSVRNIVLPKKFTKVKHLRPTIHLDADDTLVKFGEKIRDRWLIKGLIGSGGYGEIYYASDLKMNSESVAVKVEPVIRKGKIAKRMILEQKIMLRLQGQPHAPLMWGSGTERGLNYIVMQLLSTNVADLRKQCPLQRLSKATSGRIMQQAIAGLRDIHKVGYIHRDVKPANMCFGLTEKSSRRLIIVDYGLARKFRQSDGKPIEKRKRAGFRGTLRYVSMRVHDRKEQGPSDDLIALFFTLIEILKGELPWRNEKSDEKMKSAKMELVKDDFVKISENFGSSLREYGRAVMTLAVDAEPNYTFLISTMKNLAGNRPLNDPYDWENDYLEVLNEYK
ncbi:CK1/TTBKL protein kinase [Loa loa]|uniref:non-specific serine/threonine protein kinase n=1 Tax=Loa loa TaxID=7209 RepID=A0A1I7VSZ8_LOALO|nr:CK1/TTBKL protein kinase [Loa loa]EFO21879.1 CK1/TTBKL protein kinase [Loa loa]